MPARTPDTVIDRVLVLLEERGQQGVTAADVLELTGSMRCSSVIARLRVQGNVIASDRERQRTADGRLVYVSRYILVRR